MIISGNIEHGKRIAKAAGCCLNVDCDRIISREENGRLRGGVIFTNYTGVSIGMHMAGFDPRWANREFLLICFDYAFSQLKVRLCVATVPSGNLRALEIDRRLGFVEQARVKDIFRDGDLVIMTMNKDQCRWLARGKRLGKQ